MKRCRIVSFLSITSCLEGASAFGIDLHTTHSTLEHFPSLQTAFSSASKSWFDVATTASNDIIGDVISPAYATYREQLKTSPLETKVATGVVLAVVGDAIAQAREPAEYDTKRAAAFVAFDGCYRAVQQWTYPPLMAACHGQYLAGMAALLGFSPSTDSVSLMAALEQTIVSQFGIIPLFYYPVFYAVTGAVQGLTIDETIQRAKNTFIPLMKRNLAFWIPVQFGVFGFVEESLQIPILIVCGLVWTIILSISAGAVKPATETASAKLEEEIVLAMETSDASASSSGTFFRMPFISAEGSPRAGNVMQNATTANSTLAEVRN